MNGKYIIIVTDITFNLNSLLNTDMCCCMQMFKAKAIEIADKLMPAFNTPTGIPMAMVNVRRYVFLWLEGYCMLISYCCSYID